MAYKRNCKEGNLQTKLDEAVLGALIRISLTKPIEGLFYATDYDFEMAARAPRVYCDFASPVQLSTFYTHKGCLHPAYLERIL